MFREAVVLFNIIPLVVETFNNASRLSTSMLLFRFAEAMANAFERKRNIYG